MLLLITLLLIKHFIFDFLYQPPYQWMNKGTYGHWGGIIHSMQHQFGTFICLLIANPPIPAGTHKVGWILGIEYLLHYHIDWAKMNINKKMGWACNTHNQFWILTGFDQLLHCLTYIAICAYIY